MLLTILALVPIVGALIVALLKGETAKLVAMGVALTTLVLGVTAVAMSLSGAALAITVPWIRPIGAYYALSMSPMDAILVLLTVGLMPVVMLAEWKLGERWSVRGSTGGFFALALLMQGLALFVFLASDLLLFYLAFEATLIPVYFMIGRYGIDQARTRAAIKFLIYSLAGGLVLLVGIVGLYAIAAQQGQVSLLIGDLAGLDLNNTTGHLLFLCVLFAFAVKAPLVGVHTWLPDTAQSASPGTSTLLVGILDKIGTFGLIKIALVIFPDSMRWAAPVIVVWAVVSMIYGALMAFNSKHLLRLISYTSISHFGFMVFGIFALTTQSMTATIFYMLNHGLSTAAMFLTAGFLIARRGTADINAFGGVQKVAPILAGFFLISGLSALALPGMSTFVSEFLVMAGSFQRYPIHTAVIVIGMVLSAVYVLRMYKTTMTGPVTPQVEEHVSKDLSLREKAAVFPLIVIMLVLGFFPKPALDFIEESSTGFLSVAGVTDPTPQLKEGGR